MNSHTEMNLLDIKFEVKSLFYYIPYNIRNIFIKSIKKPSREINFVDILNVYRKYNCIFMHIPKNAGTSINLALYGKKDTEHIGIINILGLFKKDEFQTAFKFAFVRNPLDRLVSSYFHLSSGGWNTAHDAEFFSKHGDVTQNGFGEFVMWLSRGNNAYEHVTLIPQHEFICLGRHIMVDYLGKFETISDDFEFITKTIGCSESLPIVNTTDHKEYSTYYDNELMTICRNIYRRDFEIFRYG